MSTSLSGVLGSATASILIITGLSWYSSKTNCCFFPILLLFPPYFLLCYWLIILTCPSRASWISALLGDWQHASLGSASPWLSFQVFLGLNSCFPEGWCFRLLHVCYFCANRDVFPQVFDKFLSWQTCYWVSKRVVDIGVWSISFYSFPDNLIRHFFPSISYFL